MKHDWDVEDYKEYRRGVMRNCQRRRREQAREKGLCIICCKRETRAGMVTCGFCNDRVKRSQIRAVGGSVNEQ